MARASASVSELQFVRDEPQVEAVFDRTPERGAGRIGITVYAPEPQVGGARQNAFCERATYEARVAHLVTGSTAFRDFPSPQCEGATGFEESC